MDSSLGGKVYLGSTLALVAGGTTLAVIGHQNYKKGLLAYNFAHAPSCETDAATLQSVCPEEAVAFYDNFVWPHQKKRLAGIIMGGVGLVGMGTGFFVVDLAPEERSVADKAADRAARADAKAAKDARREAEKARDAELDRRASEAAYGDLDAVDSVSRSSGGMNGARIGVFAGATALIAGGTGWGIYEHQKVTANSATWLIVYPDCASGACEQEGYNYHTEYVWPHQVKRAIAFGTAGAGLVGLGVGMLATSPTQIQLAPTPGGMHIGLSRNF